MENFLIFLKIRENGWAESWELRSLDFFTENESLDHKKVLHKETKLRFYLKYVLVIILQKSHFRFPTLWKTCLEC